MIYKKELTKGSASSINLAIEKPNSLFLSDDEKAILYAVKIGLNVMSTPRILADATVKGLIKSINELIEKLYELKNKANYEISDEMVIDIVNVVENRMKGGE